MWAWVAGKGCGVDPGSPPLREGIERTVVQKKKRKDCGGN